MHQLAKTLYWILAALFLFGLTLGTEADIDGFENTLAFPLDQLRNLRQPMAGVFLILLFATAMNLGAFTQHNIIPTATRFYFAFQLYFFLRVLAAGFHEKAFLSGVIYLLTFVTFGLLLAAQLRTTPHDVFWVVRANAFASMLFSAAVYYQLAINASAILWNGRLWGITGSPQHAATFLAIELLPLCFLVMRKEEPWLLRAIYAAAAGCSLILLIWTGSRTGCLMAVVGLTFLFRSNWKQGLWIVCPGMLLVLLLLVSNPDLRESSERLVSTLDTRSEVWGMLVDDFEANPLFGTIRDDLELGESSYLTAAARGGLLGLVLLMLTALCTGAALLELQVLGPHLGSNAMLADLVTGVLVSLWIGAFFEGTLLGVLNFPIYALYISLALLGRLRAGFPLQEIYAARESGKHGRALAPGRFPLLPELRVPPARRIGT